MADPLVVAICITRDRPAMTRRAIESFRRQTYANKRLVIWDTSSVPFSLSMHLPDNERCVEDVVGFSIGELRNRAAEWALNKHDPPDIICHLDSDDWSHPNRISEQAALLQASGAECVGFNECLFWDTRTKILDGGVEGYRPISTLGQSYIYRNYSPDYCIGSSMMYLASAWQRVKFDHINQGEDGRFLQRVKSVGVSGVERKSDMGGFFQFREPRMICSIHGGNTSHYNPEGERNSYTRAPEWDAHCERIMKL